MRQPWTAIAVTPTALTAMAALTVLAACDRPSGDATPAEVTARIRQFAEDRCQTEPPASAFGAGYMRVADISKDGRPDYVVDFSALACGDLAAVCPDAGCPREIWVSDGRTGYTLAFGMEVRSMELMADSTPPSLTVTLAGDACPPPPPPDMAGPNPPPARAAAPEISCRRTYVFDPIRLIFQDAERAGAQAAPAETQPPRP